MIAIGQLCLLGSFVTSGFAAFACLAGWHRGHRGLERGGVFVATAALAMLTAAVGILAWALATKDFRFAYVADNVSRLVPWHYSLSALWVGQEGSLLVWAWLLGLLAVAYRFWPRPQRSELRLAAFGVLMVYVFFLVGTMLFAADPMKPTLSTPQEGAGLSPLLQHPAMLIHPPVVFFGYAACGIPFALAVVALLTGRLDNGWVREARPWTLLAWATLGAGILMGAKWAYEELGWGGYWAWDPVENGSFLPWLTATALIHCLMAWQYRGVMKKSAMALAITTFGLCNLATFLTRSGFFSSLHAFGNSPIGWIFLVMVIALAAGGLALVLVRRRQLRPDRPIAALRSREALTWIATVALLLLAGATLIGTLAVPLSDLLLGRKVIVGLAFYNNVLIPTGLILLATTAVVPVARWGKAPAAPQKRILAGSAGVAAVAAATAAVLGVRQPLALAVAALAALTGAIFIATWVRDARRIRTGRSRTAALLPPRRLRRQYAGLVIHVGVVCVALGITGSSLGSRRHEVALAEGQTIEWGGHSIRLARLAQRELPDKLVAEAQLEVSQNGGPSHTLRPAQHLHLLQGTWTTEVAIDSGWDGDFYAIVHGGDGPGRAGFTFIVNPMMRWLWLGGWVCGAGALASLLARLPVRRPTSLRPPVAKARPKAPHFLRRRRRSAAESAVSGSTADR